MAYTFTAYSATGCDTVIGSNLNVYIKHATDNDNTSLVLAPNPVRIEWSNPLSEILEPISDSVATVKILADTADETFLSDIDTADDGEYQLVLDLGGSGIFYGHVVPDLGNRQQRSRAQVVIRATTGLEYLKGVDFPTTTGRASILAIIDEALQQIGYALPYWTDVEAHPTNVATGTNALVGLYVDRSIYVSRTRDGEQVVKSCYDVLLDIMLRFGLTLRQIEGYWHIMQVPNRDVGDLKRYEYDTSLVQQSSPTASPAVTYAASAFEAVQEFPLVSYGKAYGEFNLIYDHKTKWDYWRNGDFAEDLGSDNWQKAGSNQTEISLSSEKIRPFTPNEENWNNQSLRFEPYFDPNGPNASPPAAIPYVQQLSRVDFEKTPVNEESGIVIKFSAFVAAYWFNTLRKTSRYFWYRLYDETGTYYFDASLPNGGVFTCPANSSFIDVANDRIKLTEAVGENYGLESGQSCFVRYDGSTSAEIGGLTSGNYYEVQYHSDDTFEFVSANVTTIGTGTHTFTFTRWVSSSKHNRLLITPDEVKEFEIQVPNFPATDQYYFEIYGLQDWEVEARPGAAGTASFDYEDWVKPGNWVNGLDLSVPDGFDTRPDCMALLIDGFYVETNDQREVQRRTKLTTTERKRAHPAITVGIGQGPFDITDAAISWNSAGGHGDYPTANWQGLGFSSLDLDEFLLRIYNKYKGAPRFRKQMAFQYRSSYLKPNEVLLANSKRHFPVHFWFEPVRGLFGGTFEQFASNTGTVTVTENSDRTIYTVRGLTGVTGYNVLSEITDSIGLLESGEIRLGTGSVTGGTFTGIRIFKDDVNSPEVYRVAGYNNGTLQAYLDSDGKLYAGAGAVMLDASGIQIDEITAKSSADPASIKFLNTSTSAVEAFIQATKDGSFRHDLYIEGTGAVNITAGFSGTDADHTFLVDANDGGGLARFLCGVFDVEASDGTNPVTLRYGAIDYGHAGIRQVLQAADPGTHDTYRDIGGNLNLPYLGAFASVWQVNGHATIASSGTRVTYSISLDIAVDSSNNKSILRESITVKYNGSSPHTYFVDAYVTGTDEIRLRAKIQGDASADVPWNCVAVLEAFATINASS